MKEAPLTEWLVRHRNGDPEAARIIFERYAVRLCELAQRHLSSRVRQRVDGEDVVQSVFLSFFARHASGKLRVDSSDGLWKLLVMITVRKARAVWRKHTANRRDVGRELTVPESGEDWLVQATSQEPTAVEAIVLTDEIETLLQGLSVNHARVLELRLGGLTPTEVAAEMKISRQAVHRLINALRLRLERSSQSDGGSPAG